MKIVTWCSELMTEVMEDIGEKKIKKSTVFMVCIALLLYYLLALPPISFAYLDGAFFLSTCILSLVAMAIGLKKGRAYVFATCIKGGAILILIAFIYGIIYGWDCWRASALQSQIGQIEDMKFDEHILPIAKGKLPLVDREYAELLGDKRLGEDPGLGSQVVAGEYTLQNVAGELVWVAPLEYKDLWRWLFNDGTPGYLKVSANDSRKVSLVQTLGKGEAISLRYLNSAYFTKNIEFRARRACLTYGLAEYNFEIDDQGYPYYVVSLYENYAAWKNPDATGVLLIDAQTGEAQVYSIKEAPKWIDTIHPIDFIMHQIQNWGDYINGYINPSNEGKLAPSEGYTEVYNTFHSDEGNSYYYTGITSLGKEASTTGILLVNKRTKQVIRYNFAGATEEAARASAMGQVQEKHYIASFPVPTLVHGVPAYFILLKDAAGLVKLYALVSIQDHQFVGVGETLEAVERSFTKSLTTNANATNFATTVNAKNIEGVIQRISINIEGGASFYFFLLEGNRNIIYKASYQISPELVLTEKGDKVQIKSLAPNNGYSDVLDFKNLCFDLKKEEEKHQLEKENEKAKRIK